MAGLRVGTVGGGPTVQVARPGLGTGAVSLGGGDLSAVGEERANCEPKKISYDASKFRKTFFSFCKPIISNAQNRVLFREDTYDLQVARCAHDRRKTSQPFFTASERLRPTQSRSCATIGILRRAVA